VKTRILALHGYHGSAATLRRQLAPLSQALPVDVELVLVDAPSLSRGDFGWWHLGFRGWEPTRDWVLDLAGPERLDGVLGFSQGAALTGLLAAVQQSNPDTVLRLRFAVMIGGFTSREPQHAALFARKLTLPSLHVMGEADDIVPMHDSLRLADRFADPVIVRHPGGHIVPATATVTSRIAAFIAEHGTAATAEGRHADEP
jgi:dienelactone hydrolase